MKIIQSPSQNFSTTTYKKIGVQIHITLGLMPWTLQWLQDTKSQSSCNYLIARNGDIHELVSIKDRAWSSGRIYNPSERGKKIMKKYAWGTYIKPGYYLIQIEFEGLLGEPFTEAQYKSATELFKSFDFKVTEDNFLEHQDTCSYKPDLEKERAEILERLTVVSSEEDLVSVPRSLIIELSKYK